MAEQADDRLIELAAQQDSKQFQYLQARCSKAVISRHNMAWG